MRKMLLHYLGILPMFWAHCAQGQTEAADSSLVAAATAGLNQRYAATVRAESRLYNGPEYAGFIQPYIKGHPFFETAAPRPGTIVYDGDTYPNVLFRYDLVLGLLVLKVPLGPSELQLVNEKVTRFALNGHTFIRLVVDSANAPLKTGFYDLLVEGPVRVLAARRKDVQDRATPEGMQGEISEQDEVFVYKDHGYHSVSKAKSLLSLFPEQKAVLRKYIRAQKLKFNAEGRENAIAAVVRYYATLSSSTTADSK